MKQLMLFGFMFFLFSGMVAFTRADNWNVIVRTSPENLTLVPVDLGLTLANFTVSSPAQVSNVSFDPRISELTFQATVTEADEVSGYNINITVPSEVLNDSGGPNSTYVLMVLVDNSGNGYARIDSATIGFYLNVGVHTITLNIYDPPNPPVTVPEYSVFIMLVFMLSMLSVAVIKKKQLD